MGVVVRTLSAQVENRHVSPSEIVTLYRCWQLYSDGHRFKLLALRSRWAKGSNCINETMPSQIGSRNQHQNTLAESIVYGTFVPWVLEPIPHVQTARNGAPPAVHSATINRKVYITKTGTLRVVVDLNQFMAWGKV